MNEKPTFKQMRMDEEMNKVLHKFIMFPPLTLMVFLRRNVGFRLLAPLGVLTLILIVMSLGGPPLYSPLYLFWCAALIFGIAKGINRWFEGRRGIKQHSYYLGDSIFDSLPVPGFFRRRRRMAFFFDPVFCVTVSILMLNYGPKSIWALAVWLLISSVFLFCIEVNAYKAQRARELDMVDGLVYSQYQGDEVERYSDAPKHTARPQNSDDAIPTGLGADLNPRARGRTKTPTQKP
jgi:hypothetical protein